ncbi:hypothetical protein [Kribbella capetownensis]|uniref:hypothetical protein n=1 Tax=Kribbella capetownensis TaxID=1572659 RepID=UPI0013F3E8CB|nr:hypothetical protein [Kribbella capetownensis]
MLTTSADFDAEAIRTLWASSVAGRTTAADEVALRQLLWRVVFDDHLQELGQYVTRPPAAPRAPAPVRKPVRRTLRARVKQRVRRNAAVRRLARSRAWRTMKNRE